MSIAGIKERDWPWYLTEHCVLRDGTVVDKIGRSDWADWDTSGDLLFAMDGCLYRARCRAGALAPLEDATKLADFSNLKFAAHEAPTNALHWC